MQVQVKEVRNLFLSQLPFVRQEKINFDVAYINETFILKSSLPKSLIAYLVKVDRLETWTFAVAVKTTKDMQLLNDIESIFPDLLKCFHMNLNQDNEMIYHQLSYMFARLTIVQTIYGIRYLDSVNPAYLDSLFTSEEESSVLLVKRLVVLTKAFQLARIFSYESLDRIIKILGKDYHAS